MMYHLFEQLIVVSAVACAAALAMKKWWPTKKRAASGCAVGCGGCSTGASCEHGDPSNPVERGVQRVAMPASRRRPR